MSNDEILKKLHAMHDELSAINSDLNSAEEVDAETVDALGLLVKDVHGLMDKAADAAPDNSSEEASTETTDATEHHEIREQILKFNSDHPRVSKLLNQISDVLGMMGI